MNRGSPAAADWVPMVGHTVGQYRVLGVVGEGGLGHLCVAEQRKIRDASNTVALRTIRAELARDPAFAERFAAAARVVPQLEHPNVLSIHEMSTADGQCFFSMEYLAGENVASILTRCNTGSPVPPDIAVAIVKQAANAVHYVHSLSAPAARRLLLGHGELGPSSLFVTYHGTVKWLVAGLRGPQENEAAASGEHALSWSSYRAPERGPGDPRAEVFSLGALLWTFLTGHRPQPAYTGTESDTEALGSGVAPSSIQPGVPEALDAIVLRALASEPQQSFQSARELSEALDRYLLQRDARLSHKHIRRWMAQLFDADRATLQLQIARGRDVPAALTLLASPQGGGSAPAPPRSSRHARELWSTRHSLFLRPERPSFAPPSSFVSQVQPVSTPDFGETPPTFRATTPDGLPSSIVPQPLGPHSGSRSWGLAAVIAAGAGLVLGGGWLLAAPQPGSPMLEPSRAAQPAPDRGQLEVQSNPAGASVFIDGEPTGLRTPAVLKHLAGRSLWVRVEKAGFSSAEREVVIELGAAAVASFELVASRGVVRFDGAPEGARIFVDDSRIPWDGQPLSLSVGQHAVVVEENGSLVFSGNVAVVGGEQTIRLVAEAATP